MKNKIRTLGSLYTNNYVKYLNRPLFYKTPTTYFTYKDLHKLENKYANLIADRFRHPVRKRIALILNNSIDWIAITQAAHKLDSTVIPINPKLNKETKNGKQKIYEYPNNKWNGLKGEKFFKKTNYKLVEKGKNYFGITIWGLEKVIEG